MQPFKQPAKPLDYNNKGKAVKELACGNARENGSEEGSDLGNGDGTPEIPLSYKRIRWTKEMVLLLITAVSYCLEGTPGSSGSGRKDPWVDAKKGKWRAISRVMLERGFMVSPQQCEDKFNDLNKRYKRLNDIIGRGKCCKVVENPNLLESMDLPTSAKQEVLKMLDSEQLFYPQMCSYNNRNNLFLPFDWALYQSVQVALKGKHHVEPPPEWLLYPGNLFEVEEDAENGDGFRGKRLKLHEENGVADLSNAFSMSLNVQPCDGLSSSDKWMKSKLLKLREKSLEIEEQKLALEKSRSEWQRIYKEEEMKLETMKQENERLRQENERVRLENERLETKLAQSWVSLSLNAA